MKPMKKVCTNKVSVHFLIIVSLINILNQPVFKLSNISVYSIVLTIYCIINKEKIVFVYISFNCLFDLVLCNISFAGKFQTNMASIQGMVLEDIKEETEEKIDIENDFPCLTAISGSDEEHMPK